MELLRALGFPEQPVMVSFVLMKVTLGRSLNSFRMRAAYQRHPDIRSLILLASFLPSREVGGEGLDQVNYQ